MPRSLKNINIEVGGRIKVQRTAQGMTREQLARITGYSANFIQEVERGRSGLSSESIRAFSSALKVSSDSLLFGSVSEGFEYLFTRLNAVPEGKQAYIIKILEAAIDCATDTDQEELERHK